MNATLIPRLVNLVHEFTGVVVEQFKRRVEKLRSDSIFFSDCKATFQNSTVNRLLSIFNLVLMPRDFKLFGNAGVIDQLSTKVNRIIRSCCLLLFFCIYFFSFPKLELTSLFTFKFLVLNSYFKYWIRICANLSVDFAFHFLVQNGNR